MSNRAAQLDIAAFLDSTAADAQRNAGRSNQDLQRIVGAFLDAAYDHVGKAPQHLDADDIHAIVGHSMPGQFGRTDALVEHVVPVLRAYLDHLAERVVVTHAFEQRQSLEATAPLFVEAVRSGMPHEHHHAAPKPFVHHAAKTGRNDPCPCGSGKKFKQCCLKLGQ